MPTSSARMAFDGRDASATGIADGSVDIRPLARPAVYEDLIAILREELPRHGATRLLPIATAAMDSRGYGPVKEKAVHDVRARRRIAG